MEIDVSVIIVNYNTLEMTKKCIESVIRFTKKNSYEIILVDNGSTDGSVEFFTCYPNIHFIPNGDNYGFGKANNIGAKEAHGKYLFLLNSDTILLKDIISIFFDYSESNKSNSLACCGCSLLDGNMQPTLSCGHFPSLMQEFSSIGFYRLYRNLYHNKWATAYLFDIQHPEVVDYIIGADWFINRDVFESLGGFDEDYFMYYEETDLAYRIKHLGLCSVILPEEGIIHYGGISTGSIFSVKKFKLSFESKCLFFRKNQGKFRSILMKFLSLIYYFVHPAYYKHIGSILQIIIKS